MTASLTTDKFVERASKIHGNFYDYSNVIYINNKTKIQIKCPKHGNFNQTPAAHLLGQKCFKCRVENDTFTTQKFIEKANKLHNNFYDYSKTEYVNNHTKVEIFCPEHGVLICNPHQHLRGRGCKKCGIKSKTSTKIEFIKKASKLHNSFYDYREVNYINSRVKIEIICPVHGSFTQTPHQHLQNKGCPICKQSKGEKAIRNYLEHNQIQFKQEYIVDNFRFDFILEYDIVIEYNGRQHYIPGSFGSKKENADLEKLFINIKNDCLKCKKCQENNFRLLVIPYWDIKRIPEILDDFFKGIEPTYSQPPKIVVRYESHRKAIRKKLEINESEFLCGIIG